MNWRSINKTKQMKWWDGRMLTLEIQNRNEKKKHKRNNNNRSMECQKNMQTNKCNEKHHYYYQPHKISNISSIKALKSEQ